MYVVKYTRELYRILKRMRISTIFDYMERAQSQIQIQSTLDYLLDEWSLVFRALFV